MDLKRASAERHGIEENGCFHNSRQDNVVVLRAMVVDQAQVGLLPGHAVLAAGVTIAIAHRAWFVLCQVPHFVLAVIVDYRRAEPDAHRLPRLVREQHRAPLGGGIHPQGDILGTGPQPLVDEQLCSVADVDGGLLGCIADGRRSDRWSGAVACTAAWAQNVNPAIATAASTASLPIASIFRTAKIVSRTLMGNGAPACRPVTKSGELQGYNNVRGPRKSQLSV